MTELIKHQPQASLSERINYAKALAASGLLPQAYRQQPANVLYAVEYGSALGVPPMTAIMGIHVIQGKPTLSADLMAALIRRAGHKLRIRVEPGPVAVTQVIRHDDPDYTYECRWDIDRARQAGLLDKGTWQQHPTAMLKARAISEVAREACSEVLNGLIYVPEELGATVDENGNAVDVVTGELHGDTPQTDGGVTTPTHNGVGEPPAAADPQDPAPPSPDQPDGMVTDKQLRMIGGLMRKRGLTDGQDRDVDRRLALAYVNEAIGREVESRKELTVTEASVVIDRLQRDTVQEAEPVDAEIVETEQQELS